MIRDKIFHLSFFAFVIATAILIESSTAAVIDKPSSVNIAQANEHFGLRLLHSLESKANGSTNVFVSPFSVGNVLAMAMRGASGRTYKQMSNTLGFGNFKSMNEIMAGYHMLLHQMDFKQNQQVNSPIIRVANALAVQKSEHIKLSYIEDLQNNFCSDIFKVDFHNDKHETIYQINKWANDKTNGKVSKLFEDDFTFEPFTVAILLNAIYFNGKWANAFEAKTVDRPFYLGESDKFKTVKFMHKVGRYRHAFFDDGQLLELPYQKSSMSMFVFLPNSKSSVLSSSFFKQSLSERIRHLQMKLINLRFPKFQFKASYSLVDVLRELGIEDAFNKNMANIPNIFTRKNLWISQVFQQTAIEVDQNGTEAVAVTGLQAMIVRVSSPSIPLNIEINRPFMIFIHNNDHNVVLFSGVINDPELKDNFKKTMF